jgi:hypothetical protein
MAAPFGSPSQVQILALLEEFAEVPRGGKRKVITSPAQSLLLWKPAVTRKAASVPALPFRSILSPPDLAGREVNCPLVPLPPAYAASRPHRFL